MKCQAITFDCAGTLLDVRWDPARLAITCARELGYELNGADAAAVYERLLMGSRRQYCEVNLAGDLAAVDDFWRDLTRRWGASAGIPESAADSICAEATRRLFDPHAGLMRLYDDVRPALDRLSALGIALAVVSNWDLSLYRALEVHGLSAYFDVVVPSLEIGHEKPDPEIFRCAVERLGVGPERAAHIGDDPLDDLYGARSFGMVALLLDRSNPNPRWPVIASLLDLEAALA
jgi:putative hydrolase of the HAD superfamily